MRKINQDTARRIGLRNIWLPYQRLSGNRAFEPGNAASIAVSWNPVKHRIDGHAVGGSIDEERQQLKRRQGPVPVPDGE